MTSTMTNLLGPALRYLVGTGLAAALAACSSSPIGPISDSQQAPGARAVGDGPLWARQLVVGKLNCELDDTVDVKIGEGQQHIVVNWKGKTYLLLPVSTTTGALRFEDRGSGLVWLQIPSKSMLLNAKTGQQMANDCVL